MSRQVPRLPQATAGSKKRSTKVNKSSINGRIMDPVARRTAQRAAKTLRAREADVSHATQPAPVNTQPHTAAAVNVLQTVNANNCFHLTLFSDPYRTSMITMKSAITALRLIHWHPIHKAGLQFDWNLCRFPVHHLYGHL
jgi:hypothetical protein